ncbi:glutamate racemase [Vallitalea okinawensis]|uniref:glutamate racemase n=1 Tax=Vallitalea okinawensis TaxID=2078660 RepID=UPI000CFA808F|nr:glutamate racemase [Vallitalea okinawensis]
MKIGIFDSGIGGITVLKQAIEKLPMADFIYYADTLNVPYGTKSSEQVKGYVDDVVSFLMARDIEALVIACNTATSIAVRDLRNKYNIPIIGMEPAIKPAIREGNTKKVLVLATELTLKQAKFKELVSSMGANERITGIPAPRLVEFAEKGQIHTSEVLGYLEEIFKNINFNEYEYMVLGCTHFIYFKQAIRKIVPEHMKIIDGNQGTTKHLFNLVKDKYTDIENKGSVKFFYDGILDEKGDVLRRYLQILED